VYKRRKGKGAQREEKRISIGLQQMEERELHPTMDRREREREDKV